MAIYVKGTISDPKFQTSLFSEPPDFWHIQEEIHYNKVHVEQFPRKQHIFGKTDNFYCWELIIAGDNKFKPVFLVINHLNFYFLKF